MASRRCNLRCAKKEPDPERGRTRIGGTMMALSAFHESLSDNRRTWSHLMVYKFQKQFLVFETAPQ